MLSSQALGWTLGNEQVWVLHLGLAYPVGVNTETEWQLGKYIIEGKEMDD